MSKAASLSAEQHRPAAELDTLSAILCWDARDKLATLLTDADVATLKHLAQEGMGENRLGSWLSRGLGARRH